MATNRTKLTAEVQRRICAFIRAGGHPRVAAVAAGVSPAQFERRLQGRNPFRREVEKAAAEARLAAEIAAFKGKPLDWLRCGPGRETTDSPGWTGAARPAYQGESAAAFLQSTEFQTFIHLVRRVLAPFPEALAALTQALNHPGDEPHE
jgi:hypothetical protein